MGEFQDLADAQTCALLWADDANKFVCSHVLKDDVEGVEGIDLAEEYYEGAVPVIDEMIAKGEEIARLAQCLGPHKELKTAIKMEVADWLINLPLGPNQLWNSVPFYLAASSYYLILGNWRSLLPVIVLLLVEGVHRAMSSTTLPFLPPLVHQTHHFYLHLCLGCCICHEFPSPCARRLNPDDRLAYHLRNGWSW